jgi:hypothetical protein
MKSKKNLLTGLSTGASMFLLSASTVFAQAKSNLTIAPPKGFFPDFANFGSTVLRIVFVIAAILVFAYLIMGGLEWITSGGEKSKTEAARNKITAAVVGLVILVASWALMNLILSLLTGGQYGDINSLIQQNLQ